MTDSTQIWRSFRGSGQFQCTITKEGRDPITLTISAEQLAELLFAAYGQASVAPPAPKPKTPRQPKRSAAGNDKWKALDDVGSHGRRLTDDQKTAIEDMLIERIPVATIAQEHKTSEQTVYIIKARLKKEGRL